MTPEQTEAVKKHAQAIAEILYTDTDPKTLESLEAIEQVVRQKLLEHVSPQVGIFLSNRVPAPPKAESERSRVVSES